MIYLLQDKNESDAMQIEIEELKIVLDELSNTEKLYNHQYETVKSTDFLSMSDDKKELYKKSAIPVGSIEFVQSFLSSVHDINKMNPIEIPKCLRLPHLLMRDYYICTYDQLPKNGNYFIKDVSRLKSWAAIGKIEEFLADDKLDNKDKIFQVSSVINIISEYRVFVSGNNIYGIQFYDGDPTVMPNEIEIKKIKEMVLRWSCDKNCPGAYTMDVAVIRSTNNTRELVLIECHPFCAVGTYGCRGAFLPKMYQLGLSWYIKHNDKIT